MQVTVAVANITPAEFAALAQAAGLAGSVHANLGFGPWDVEPGVTAEFGLLDQAGADAVLGFVRELLGKRGEQAAYVVVDGQDRLLYARQAKPDGCRNCRRPVDDGEGWDGLCGNCADRAESAS